MTHIERRREQRELRHIDRLHFLVHPGFTLRNESRNAQHQPDTQATLRAHFQRYEATAEALQPNELLLVLTSAEHAQLRDEAALQPTDDNQLSEIQLLRSLKRTLRDRLIVLTNDIIFTVNPDDPHKVNGKQSPEKFVEVLQRISQARGFVIDQATLVEAYGELFGLCINQYTEFLHEQMDFTVPPTIRTDLSLTEDPFTGEIKVVDDNDLADKDEIRNEYFSKPDPLNYRDGSVLH